MTETGKIKRGPGRPKGYPKSGGRARGTPNKDRSATIERIQKEADPILFLCKVCRGDRMEAAPEPGAQKRTHWFPTADQRITAAQTLARKVLPDLKAIEGTGVVVENVFRVVHEMDDDELDRRLAELERAYGEATTLDPPTGEGPKSIH